MENIKELGLLNALEKGPVICAEGYLFEMERRGYLKANLFVPEVVLDNPRVVEQLHRDFVHAGSDVVLAFTYYVDREKLKIIGKEDVLETMYHAALRIAKKVADEPMSGNQAIEKPRKRPSPCLRSRPGGPKKEVLNLS
jgi:betaine-homocysteine S-methyltransferase